MVNGLESTRMQNDASIDPAEIAKFESLARTWWDASGPMRSLHQINPLRTAFICEQIREVLNRNDKAQSRLLEGLSAVDVGCAGGLVSEPLASMGADVTGLDPAQENIAVARLHAEQSGLSITYRNETLEDAVSRGETYDLVTALEVIEHVADVPAFVETCCKAVKPGGLLFLSTLNRTLRSLALAKVAAEYVLGWLPRGTHDWHRFIRPEELERHLRENGFRLKAVEGIVFCPLTFSWKRSQDIAVNYQVCAVRMS
jgi:ubiquinone biosynthesis O-methyltransferase